MSSDLKPIKLYSHIGGPNPWKCAIVLEELGIPYEHDFIDFKVIKEEPFISTNPNGRVPAIDDPNTGITLWESGAIVQYLAATYDKQNKISSSSSPDKFLIDQWLFFQCSGQGPYYGQYFWFMNYHPEKLPSAQERYKKEMIRVASVINLHLEKTGGQWLVGDKCTYADLSFVPWGWVPARVGVDLYEGGQNQAYKAWWERLEARESVKKVAADKEAAMKKGH